MTENGTRNNLPPLKLRLEDYRLIEKIINDIDEPELTDEEKKLRWKVRRIAENIEKAISRNIRENQEKL